MPVCLDSTDIFAVLLNLGLVRLAKFPIHVFEGQFRHSLRHKP